MKLFVWDFHGVLEQDNELAVHEISNSVLTQFGFTQQFTKADTHKLNGLKWYQYFEYLLPNEKTEIHLKLQQHCFELSNNQPEIIARYIKPSNHSHKVLKAIKAKHDQILISNTSTKSLEIFIKAVKIESFFNSKNSFAVDGHTPNQVVTKKHILDKYLENKSYDQIVVIGDSPTDIELANLENAVSYLYSHPGKNFRYCTPTFKINDLQEILREI